MNKFIILNEMGKKWTYIQKVNDQTILTLRLHLFCCKIFFITKYFQIKMILGKIIFFLCLVAFQKMLQKIFYNVVRKIEQKGQGVRRAFLENGLQKNWT